MPNHHFDLSSAAYEEMLREGFHPDFSAQSQAQVSQIRESPLETPGNGVRDLRDLVWSSIDNDTSRDLDQIEIAERVNGGIRIRVGVADVARSVPKNSPIDEHASGQTQTVYTAVRNFPMLPLQLSTGLTSLNENEDRAAVIIEFQADAKGVLGQPNLYLALVRNRAQLAYRSVGGWLEGSGGPDAKVAASTGLQDQLRLQDEAARVLREERIRQGALDFHRVEADPVVIDGKVQSIRTAPRNRATDLIEEFMIAANETMARTLRAAKRSCIRRVVKSPERWARIVDLAASHGTSLPAEPNSAALNVFLQKQRASDPTGYPDLSLAVIKLIGPGEYVLAKGDEEMPPGHFGLAVLDYTHSTAPNRRFADLVTQRVVKALLAGAAPPYTDDELAAIATHCTERESAARKVERRMQKRVAAVALENSVGKSFHGIITGNNEKGVFVRILEPPVEGKIVEGEQGLDVGDKVEVVLVRADPQRAFIDFARRH